MRSSPVRFVLCALCLAATVADGADTLATRWWRNIGEIGSALKSEASEVWRHSADRAAELAACPIGECCVPQYIAADTVGKYIWLVSFWLALH